VTISGSTVTVVPTAGFAGRITVPVTVVHGSATMTTSVVVLVKPAAVTHGWHDLTARATTVVHWPATPGAVTYEVRVNGVLKCVTSARTCGVARLLGPKARVTVTAVGHNAVRGTATRQPYRTHGCVEIGAVHFGRQLRHSQQGSAQQADAPGSGHHPPGLHPRLPGRAHRQHRLGRSEQGPVQAARPPGRRLPHSPTAPPGLQQVLQR
jgi:hypothetical protein